MSMLRMVFWFLSAMVTEFAKLLVRIGEIIALLGGLAGLAIIVYTFKDQVVPIKQGISRGQSFGVQDILSLGIDWELILISTIAIGVGAIAVRH